MHAISWKICSIAPSLFHSHSNFFIRFISPFFCFIQKSPGGRWRITKKKKNKGRTKNYSRMKRKLCKFNCILSFILCLMWCAATRQPLRKESSEKEKNDDCTFRTEVGEMLKVEWKKKSIEWGKWNFISLLQILLLFLLVRAFAVDVATTSFLLRHTHTRLSIRKSFLGKLLKKLFNTLITSFQKVLGGCK